MADPDYRIDLAEFTRRELTGYLPSYQHFADELSKVIRPSDLIWVMTITLSRSGRSFGNVATPIALVFFYTFRSPPLSSYTSRRSWDALPRSASRSSRGHARLSAAIQLIAALALLRMGMSTCGT